ncbi:MAG TPA: PEGA domain-containing protein [Anaeromyxobacter sp.]
MTPRPIAAAVALLVACAPAVAAAVEALGVLAVADPPGPTGELAAATAQLRAALAAAMPGVLGAAELRERMTGPPPPSSLAELQRAHAGAVAAYAAGQFDTSIKTLRAVVEALEALPPSAEVFAEWTATMLRLARTEQELGRRVEAQAMLERLLRAAPETRPDARRYPPSFLSLVEDSRERLRSAGTRRLAVESEPGVRVFVDGREVGTSPVTVALPPGRYRVAGERGGVRAPGIVADLSEEDRALRLDLSVADALRPDGGPGLALASSDRPLRIVTAAARLALDRAVTTSLLRDGEVVLLVATMYDLRRGRAEREGRIRLDGGAPPPGGLEALAAFLATGQASALVFTPSGPTLALQAVPRPGSALAGALAPMQPGRPSRAYGLAAAATGAATILAVVGTVDNATRASQQYSAARAMLDASGNVRAGLSTSDYNGRIRYGDEDRVRAIGFGVATAVGIVATIVLSRASNRQGGEVGSFQF